VHISIIYYNNKKINNNNKPLTWDITVTSTLAKSYIHASSHMAGGAAELAASWKEAKYSCLTQSHIFYPLEVFTQRNFVAEFIRFKLIFIHKNDKFTL